MIFRTISRMQNKELREMIPVVTGVTYCLESLKGRL